MNLNYVIIDSGENMNLFDLLSFNIRIDVPSDGLNAWPNRRDFVISFIQNRNDDLIGIQEAGPHMYKSLKNALVDYESFGIGRDHKGESTPIFVKKDKFKIIESDTIWLTHTPNEESSILGSNHPRIATYVVLQMKDDRIIAFFNTHLDYTGDQTTRIQTKHLLNYIKLIENKYNALVVISGDFNSYPSTQTIKLIENEYQSCYLEKHKNQLTFHGFSNQNEGEPIDYIFYNPKLTMKSFEIIEHVKGYPYLSDHYPITVKLG